MSILCAGDTHVFQLGSATCDCGLWANLTKPYPLSGGVIPGYTPNSFAPQRPPTPPTAGQAPEVNIQVFQAARALEDATHLSADGQRVYLQRSGNVRVCFWDEKKNRWGSSFPCVGLPIDAVAM